MADAAPDEQARLLLKQLDPDNWPISIDQLPEGTALVGGALRDALLGRHNPHPDLDLVVRSDALRHSARLAKIFGGKHVVLDEQRDIARLVLNGWTIDVARQEGDGLEDDLWRRDYSINAIALPLQPMASLCDPTGGLGDLKQGRLRAVREQNLIDDPLRLLRGLRFLAEIPLILDAQTGEWIQRHHKALGKSAPERILAELQRLVKGPHAEQALQLLERWPLLQPWATTSQTVATHDTTLLDASEKAVALPCFGLNAAGGRSVVPPGGECQQGRVDQLKLGRVGIAKLVFTVSCRDLRCVLHLQGRIELVSCRVTLYIACRLAS